MLNSADSDVYAMSANMFRDRTMDEDDYRLASMANKR